MLLDEEDADEHRDRGALLARLERFEEAAREIELYLQVAVDAPDSTTVREQLNSLRRQQAMRN
jgi:regulator of sirC expression with transglutaminase-like and TPR domain